MKWNRQQDVADTKSIGNESGITGKSIDGELDILDDEFVFFDEYVKGPMKTTRPRGYRLIESGELPPLIRWGGRLGWWKSMLNQHKAEQIRRAYEEANAEKRTA